MKISLVVAKSKNNVIGKNNQLPWHLPADLKHFKNVTMGKPIIMGRKTFDSIGKPLPGRRNIIVSRDKSLSIAGCEVFHSIDDALNVVKNEAEVMIIGGENLFSQTINRANCIYLTVIDADFDGDTFFVQLNHDWKLISEEKHTSDAHNAYGYCFQLWEK
jgi:dihydrofolate reductase